MGIKEAYRLIAPSLRKQLPAVIAITLLSALLDLVGIAALVSILLLVLDESAITSNATLSAIYDWFGFSSTTTFAVVVAIGVLLIILLKSAAGVLFSNYLHRYTIRLYHDLSRRMFDNYLNRGLLFVRNHNTADLVNTINSLCYRFAIYVAGTLLTMATEGIVLLLLVVALTIYSPIVVVMAAVLFVPMGMLYARVVRRKLVENGTEENRQQIAQNKAMFEALRGYGEVVINNAKPYISRRFGERLDLLGRYSLRANRMRSIARYLTEISLVAGVVVIMAVGVAMGEPLAQLKVLLGVFAVASYRMVPAINRILTNHTEYKRHTFIIETLTTELASHNKVVEELPTEERMPFEHTIELQDVTFAYTPESEPVLRNLSLSISKGERVGITGPSGAGKSTLLNIIAALIEPDKGMVSVDGTPITPSNRRHWQNNIAYVSQELFLPDVSIAENIAFGKERSEIDNEHLWSAIRAARLEEFVNSLPNGIDSITGEGGSRLSGGQRQRIGIARALYRKADLLLFDEATSSLDRQTEQEVVEAIEALSKADHSLTILIVSHHPKSLELCERIITIPQP